MSTQYRHPAANRHRDEIFERVAHTESEVSRLNEAVDGIRSSVTRLETVIQNLVGQLGNRGVNWGWVFAGLFGFISVAFIFTQTVLTPLQENQRDLKTHISRVDDDAKETAVLTAESAVNIKWLIRELDRERRTNEN